MTIHSVELSSLEQSRQIASSLASSITTGVVYLIGDLGACKTTLTRYWLESLGVATRIKSPTYTLVEEYQIGPRWVYHLDLYRLEIGEDYLDLGLDDLPEQTLMLIEWPDKAAGFVPKPDLVIQIGFAAQYGEQGRKVSFTGSKASSLKLASF